VATLSVLALLATLVAGWHAWSDFVLLVSRVSDPISTPNNVTPGAVVYQLGVSRDAAGAIQLASMALAAAAVVYSAYRLPTEPSYLVTVVASQLMSPILWDHYALLLLLPVAWMLDQGRWWAAGAVLLTSVAFVGLVPAWVYPVTFWSAMLGVIGVAVHQQRGRAAVSSAGPVNRVSSSA
jgi:hypothetical protein